MKKLLSAILALTLILTLAPIALADKDDDDVAYPVEGGNIYIDEATKTVTDADEAITAAVIPDGVTSIDDRAFFRCTSLTSVTIPDSVTSIGYEAFRFCYNLTKANIPDGVISIGAVAFFDCGLTCVVIPNSVTSIGGVAFSDCVRLEAILVDSGNTSYISRDGVLFTSDSKVLHTYPARKSNESYIIPDGVTSISDKAFSKNNNLTNVTIPDSVTDIGASAFSLCTRLASVTIPGSVANIGDGTFFGCDSLKDVYYSGSEEQWSKIDISSNNEPLTSATIHYNSAAPADTTTPASFTDAQPGGAYTNAVNWATENKFADAESATTFGTANPCPRWEVVSILWKAMGSPEPETTVNPFTDVSESDPYYKAILWAYENGITTGVSKTEFGVNATVKRCDAMTFIHRAADEPASAASNPFADVAAEKYYAAPVLWAVENGITTGTDATHFAPETSVTRGQMVTFLYRWLVENA